MSGKPVTLTAVARACGLSVSAVSYALRGAPNIPPATADRVRRTAATLGYRPHPRVAELMAHIRHARQPGPGERLAFVWMDAPFRCRPFATLWAGARERAEQLGFALEEFWLKEPGLTATRLETILTARGLTGVILSPLCREARYDLRWNWQNFAGAVIGNAAGFPELPRSGHHHFSGMREAINRLTARGHRRIATWLDAGVNERAKRAWSGAFLAHHPQPSQARSLLRLEKGAGPTDFSRWWKHRRPEALITLRTFVPLLPKTVLRQPIVLLDRAPNAPNAPTFPGIDQAEDLLAARAVDLVTGQLARHERGLPDLPAQFLLPGRWREGKRSFSNELASDR